MLEHQGVVNGKAPSLSTTDKVVNNTTKKEKKNKKTKPLSQSLEPTRVVCRIRPLANSGGHANTTDPNEISKHVKALQSYSASSVTLSTQYTFSKGNAEYIFDHVLGPDATQKEVYDDTNMEELVTDYTNGRDVMMFAYGQTGSGKTHTMLGTDEALKTTTSTSTSCDDDDYDFDYCDDDYGLFPRVYQATQKIIKEKIQQQQQQEQVERKEEKEENNNSTDNDNDNDNNNNHDDNDDDYYYCKSYVLSASAVEFYLTQCMDLLNPGTIVEIDSTTRQPAGAKSMIMNSTQDLLHFLQQVQRNRSTRGTRMNEVTSDHSGSSRSHAAIILTLHQAIERKKKNATTATTSSTHNINKNSTKNCNNMKMMENINLQVSTFTIMDLAGAERPSKTGEKRFSSVDMMLWENERYGTEVPTGAQCYIINFELSLIGTEIQRATDCHKSKKGYYSPPTQLSTDVVRFLGNCFTGHCKTSMILCLSPANVNGWETWFSLEFAKKVNQLKIRTPPPHSNKSHKILVPISKALKEAQQQSKDATELFLKAKPNKYYEKKKLNARIAKLKVEQLHEFVQKLLY